MTVRYRSSVVPVTFVLALLLVSAGCGGDDSSSEAEPVATTVVETFRRAAVADDLPSAVATFADDILLHSPALVGPEYRGRDVAASIVGPAFQILEDVSVTDVLESGDRVAGGFAFDARVGDEPAQGFVLMRVRDGMVSELTLLLRPLPALQAFVSRMGELGAQPALDLERKHG